MDAHARKNRGWAISAIARRVECDHKLVQSYLNGERVPGIRARPNAPDRLADFEAYIRARLSDDHHVWGTVLFEGPTRLGYSQSYPTSVRRVRMRGLRGCEPTGLPPSDSPRG